MKKVSVILPVYNVEKYITKCIDSITAQSFLDFEIIVIDDCGNDRSIEICENKLSTSRIPYVIIHNEYNKGLSESRNIGIYHSKSEYVVCIDSDDWIDKYMLEKLYTAAVEHDADIVSCAATKFWEDTNKFTEMLLLKKGEYYPYKYLKLLFTGQTSAHICFRLIRSELFKNIQFPKQVIFEDVLTIPYLIINANKVIQLEDFLYFYVQRSSKTSIAGSKPTNIDGFLSHLKKLKNDSKFNSMSAKSHHVNFIYHNLIIIMYTLIFHSSKYSEIKLELKSLSRFIELKDIIPLKSIMSIKHILYLVLLKLNKHLFYLSYNTLIFKRF